jgi:PAS domain S-box-containing protein
MRNKKSIIVNLLIYIAASLLWFYAAAKFLLPFIKERNLYHQIDHLLYILLTTLLLFYLMIREKKRWIEQQEISKSKEEEISRIHLERFKTVTSATHDILWDWDIENNTVWRNENYERIIGHLSTETALSSTSNWINYLYKEDRQKIQTLLQNALHGTETYLEGEYRIISKDNKVIDILDRGHIYRDANGKAIRMVGSMQDITPLRSSQRLLQQSEEHYRKIVETAHEGIWQINDKGITTFVNPAILKMLGYTKEEMIGVFMLDFVFKEDIEEAKDYMKRHLKGLIQQFEFKLKKKNGEALWVLVKGTLIFEEGIYKGSLGMITDISELKEANRLLEESELNYRLLFKDNPMPMWVHNIDTLEFLAVNEAALQHYGYTTEEFLKLKVSEIRPVEDKERFLQKRKLIIDNNISKVGIWRHLKKNGEVFYADIMAKRITYNGITANLALIHDISEKLKAQEELVNSYNEIRKLAVHLQHIRDDERKRIAREIHDELGQKLTAIKMDVAWLDKQLEKENSNLNPKTKEILAFLDESNTSIKNILNELRTDFLSRFGTGESLKWLTGQFIKQTGNEVELSIDEDIDELDDTVANCLYRVMQESLTNITKYADANKVKVKLKKQVQGVLLEIEDDGKGFDMNSIKPEGSFGLLGMKERVADLKGTFTITTSPGNGTIIHAEIPVNFN